MIRRIIFFIAVVITAAGIAMAQSPKGVDWSMTVKMTSATEGVLTINADVVDGWHLYGTTLPEGGPSATTISLSATKGVKFIGKLTPDVAPVKVEDAMFGMELNWWDSPVNFSCKISVKDAPKSWKIIANISNMACNDETCIPPTDTELTVTSAEAAKK